MTREFFMEQRDYLKNLIMEFVANEYDEYEDADEGTIHTPSWDINSILDYVEDHLDTEDELIDTIRDKEEVCGFDKEDALRQRWGE